MEIINFPHSRGLWESCFVLVLPDGSSARRFPADRSVFPSPHHSFLLPEHALLQIKEGKNNMESMSVGNAALMQIKLSWKIFFFFFVVLGEFNKFLKVSWAIIKDNTLLAFFFRLSFFSLSPSTPWRSAISGQQLLRFSKGMLTARTRLPHVPDLTQKPLYI